MTVARLSRLFLKDELREVIDEALNELSNNWVDGSAEVEDEDETQYLTDAVFAFLTEHDSDELEGFEQEEG